MATTSEQLRAHRGPVLLTGGFRPFFLFGSVWAVIAILVWMPLFEGHIGLPTAFAPVDWHVHELLWGYVAAAIAGFLLTAIPNWTGRLPVVGRPLALLVALWGLGRIAVFTSAWIGAIPAAVIDMSFLVALLVVTAREVLAGRNTRNLRVLAIVALFALGNLVFHVEAITRGSADYGTRLGIAGALLLVSLIGGRIVPSFTANWLRPKGDGAMPVPFARFDGIVIAVSAAAFALWVALPTSRLTGAALLVAGCFQAARLARWVGWRAASEPIVWVLHVAYLFLVLGFFLLGTTLLGLSPLLPSAALHAWTIGALALMTLAVMTRASLGHTGRPIRSTPALVVIYLGAVFAALARIAMGLGHAEIVFLHLAMVGWLVAFAGFAIVYWPILARPKE